MAIRHGLAGQFAKNEAKKRTERSFLLLALATSLGIGAASFAWGFFWSLWGQAFGFLALALVAVALWCIWSWVGRLFDAGAKDRIKYMRGGQVEAYVAWILEDLEDDWHIFNGIKLESSSDIDRPSAQPAAQFVCAGCIAAGGDVRRTA